MERVFSLAGSIASLRVQLVVWRTKICSDRYEQQKFAEVIELIRVHRFFLNYEQVPVPLMCTVAVWTHYSPTFCCFVTLTAHCQSSFETSLRLRLVFSKEVVLTLILINYYNYN